MGETRRMRKFIQQFLSLRKMDPKPLFDFFRQSLVAGFLVYYGNYLGERDQWPVHDFLGPTLVVLGLVLYVINGNWGWRILSRSMDLSECCPRWLYYLTMIVYIVALIVIADAFVHSHHQAFN